MAVMMTTIGVKKKLFLFLLSILWVGTAKGQYPTIEHFIVDNIIYVIEGKGESVSVASWNWECGVVPAGHIKIPSTVTYKSKKYIVKNIQSGVFRDCEEISSVTIPPTIVSIGDESFQHCSKLETINIPNSVVSIGKSVFQDCI